MLKRINIFTKSISIFKSYEQKNQLKRIDANESVDKIFENVEKIFKDT